MKQTGRKVFLVVIALMLAVSFAGCSGRAMTAEDLTKVRGSWSGDVYTNSFLGLTYTLPSSAWVALSDAEIFEFMDLDPALLEDEKALLNQLTEEKTVYDFVVENTVYGSNISINFENLSLTLGGTAYTEEDYADVIKENLQEDSSYVLGDYKEVTVAGATYLKFPATVSDSGYEIEQAFYMRKIDNFMVLIVVTCGLFSNQTPDQLMEGFTAI